MYLNALCRQNENGRMSWALAMGFFTSMSKRHPAHRLVRKHMQSLDEFTPLFRLGWKPIAPIPVVPLITWVDNFVSLEITWIYQYIVLGKKQVHDYGAL